MTILNIIKYDNFRRTMRVITFLALLATLNAFVLRPSLQRVSGGKASSSSLRSKQFIDIETKAKNVLTTTAFIAPLILSEPAQAADLTNAIPSALAAYGHYLGLVVMSMCLAAERLLVKPNMSADDESKLVIADSLYGIFSVLVLVSGYFRVTEYGKGWEFYQHEPIFWIKMLLLSVLGTSSLFPTIKIIQRAVQAKNASEGKAVPPSPLSEKLSSRMTKIINGELLAICTIPVTAALMSRGVGYAEWFPWQAGAAPVALTILGLSFKYVREALVWEED